MVLVKTIYICQWRWLNNRLNTFRFIILSIDVNQCFSNELRKTKKTNDVLLYLLHLNNYTFSLKILLMNYLEDLNWEITCSLNTTFCLQQNLICLLYYPNLCLVILIFKINYFIKSLLCWRKYWLSISEKCLINNQIYTLNKENINRKI